ncbi:MAG: hypothetical protein L3J22_05280 [Xanthomonadales bacterium]|nr:hypothetical protein [Xanthomonadales bacterium]
MASGFSAEIHRRTDTFEEAAETAMSDGKISLYEANRLEQYRESLGLTEAQAQGLIKTAERKHYGDACPHCNKSLTDAPESTKPTSDSDSEKHS